MVLLTTALLQADASAPGWGYGWHGFFWAPLMLVVWIGLLVAFAWLITRGWWAHGGPRAGTTASRGSERAKEILAERYARGEISTEEYWERRDQLS